VLLICLHVALLASVAAKTSSLRHQINWLDVLVHQCELDWNINVSSDSSDHSSEQRFIERPSHALLIRIRNSAQMPLGA